MFGVVFALEVCHRPQDHRLMHCFSGQGIPPTLERATVGYRIHVDSDRVGVGARGEQLECRVVGGRSCVEAIVGWEFYFVDWCAHPINS